MREVAVLDDDRASWLAARKQGIGGSDVAAIMGLDPWRGPFDVYVDKITDDTDESASPVMRLGQLLEDGIAQAYAETTGSTISKPTHLLAHDDHDWMLGTPDRWTDNRGDGVLEVKLSHRSEEWEQGVPERYQLQAMHYVAVTGLPYCDVAALLHGRDLRVYEVERDDAMIDGLVAIEREFWQRVLDRDPPTPDRLSAASLRKLYANTDPTPIELPDWLGDTIEELRQARLDEKSAKARGETAANIISAALCEHEVGTIDGIEVVTWKPHDRHDINRDAIEWDYPGLLDQYRTTTVVRPVKPKGKR